MFDILIEQSHVYFKAVAVTKTEQNKVGISNKNQ